MDKNKTIPTQIDYEAYFEVDKGSSSAIVARSRLRLAGGGSFLIRTRVALNSLSEVAVGPLVYLVISLKGILPLVSFFYLKHHDPFAVEHWGQSQISCRL